MPALVGIAVFHQILERSKRAGCHPSKDASHDRFEQFPKVPPLSSTSASVVSKDCRSLSGRTDQTLRARLTSGKLFLVGKERPSSQATQRSWMVMLPASLQFARRPHRAIARPDRLRA